MQILRFQPVILRKAMLLIWLIMMIDCCIRLLDLEWLDQCSEP